MRRDADYGNGGVECREGAGGGNWDDVLQREREERLDVRHHPRQPFFRQSLDAP